MVMRVKENTIALVVNRSASIEGPVVTYDKTARFGRE